MRTKEFSKASYAFGNVISLDPDTGDAWSNLASCNMQMKKYKEAQVCLEQAVKHC